MDHSPTIVPVSDPVPCPPGVPEKFWDAGSGALRVEALLKSYLELEKRLSAGPAAGPPVRPSLLADPEAAPSTGIAAGAGVGPGADRPDTPDGYCIACDHGLFRPDPVVNARLHAAGLGQSQAQLVYDLAAEVLLPALRELATELEAEREMERLVQQFGGPEAWRGMSRQILAWARRNLPAPVVEALSGTAEGVMALHRLMQGAEPGPLKTGEAEALGEGDLHRMVRDPRYWRDRDPAFIASVTEGFRQIYGR